MKKLWSKQNQAAKMEGVAKKIRRLRKFATVQILFFFSKNTKKNLNFFFRDKDFFKKIYYFIYVNKRKYLFFLPTLYLFYLLPAGGSVRLLQCGCKISQPCEISWCCEISQPAKIKILPSTAETKQKPAKISKEKLNKDARKLKMS